MPENPRPVPTLPPPRARIGTDVIKTAAPKEATKSSISLFRCDVKKARRRTHKRPMEKLIDLNTEMVVTELTKNEFISNVAVRIIQQVTRCPYALVCATLDNRLLMKATNSNNHLRTVTIEPMSPLAPIMDG